MSSTLVFVGLPEDSKSSIIKVPNAPKSCIGEIFSSDIIDGSPKNGISRPRAVRDTPTRPRDTHSRLFGQSASNMPAPMVTDNIRSHIQFGESEMNGVTTPSQSPSKTVNGSATSTPSRGEMLPSDYSVYMPPRRNPVTGDGVVVRPPRRRHPAASLRGAHPHCPGSPNLLEPSPNHAYYTHTWPPDPGDYYVESITKPRLRYEHTPYSLIGLYPTQDIRESPPKVDPDSLSPQPILDRHWPPLPGQYNVEQTNQKIPYHPLPQHAFVGMTSALGDRPQPDFKYNPIPTLDGVVDPYLVSNLDPHPTLMKYEYDGPIPDVTLFETPVTRGPHTLTGFPPIFHKHVPGYLFKLDRQAEDFRPKTYYLDYVRQRNSVGV